MITAMMNESADRKPGRSGRPALSPEEKKKQKSVYLSSDDLTFLLTINDNLSAAIEKLVEEGKKKRRNKKI